MMEHVELVEWQNADTYRYIHAVCKLISHSWLETVIHRFDVDIDVTLPSITSFSNYPDIILNRTLQFSSCDILLINAMALYHIRVYTAYYLGYMYVNTLTYVGISNRRTSLMIVRQTL